MDNEGHAIDPRATSALSMQTSRSRPDWFCESGLSLVISSLSHRMGRAPPWMVQQRSMLLHFSAAVRTRLL
jgi:hypothetical protein